RAPVRRAASPPRAPRRRPGVWPGVPAGSASRPPSLCAREGPAMGPPARRRRTRAPLRTAALAAGVGALALAAAAAAFAQPAGQAAEATRRRTLLSAAVGLPAALAGAAVAGADETDGLVRSGRKGPSVDADMSEVVAPMSPKSATGVPMARPSLRRALAM
ncbi:unnamed protein product, partial [Prorocentrum cordatum]